MNLITRSIKAVKRLVRVFKNGPVQKMPGEPRTQVKHYYSHYGEDIILDHIFENQSSGFYVDVGAFHPVMFSNTKKLYERGWRGINIDANEESIALFRQDRSDDINLNLAVSDQEGDADYYVFLDIDEAGGGSGNSLSVEIKEAYERQGLKPRVKRVAARSLKSILADYAGSRAIDFMNIDVEGFDLKALQSNDWTRYRPKVIAAEIWMQNIDYDNLMKDDVYAYLHNQGYRPFSNTIHTWFFYDTLDPVIRKS